MITKEHLFPIIGVGAAVTAAVSYIVWGGHDLNTSRGSKRKVAGLENLGNTCYLNTILQSLAACPKFVLWLQRALRNAQFKGQRENLAYKLSKTLQVVNDYSSSHSGSTIYSPHDVLYALNKCNWTSNREQQDCQELFQFLLTELQADTEKLSSILSLSDAPQITCRNGVVSKSTLRSSIDAFLPHISTRGLYLPFRGLIAHHLSCTACGHKITMTYTQFDCLSINIPVNSLGMTSLEEMLESFTQVELVQDVECTECSKRLSEKLSDISSPCNSTSSTSTSDQSNKSKNSPICKRVFQKQMTLAKLPQCLCIHMQRVTWTSKGLPMRREEHVMFPEKLDMTSYRQIAGVGTSCEKGIYHISDSVKGYLDTVRIPSAIKHNFIGKSFLQTSKSLPIVGGTASLTSFNSLVSSDTNESLIKTSSYTRTSEPQYMLMSAVVHLGDATSGHFLTYRRTPSSRDYPISTRWLCISDENVTRASLVDVLSQKAYMLYYQRV